MNNPRKEYWTIAILWVTTIYTTLYIARPVCELLKELTPFNILVNTALILTGIIFVTLFFKKIRVVRKSTYALLLLIILTSGVIFSIIKIPEERIHIIEYGLLAFFVYRALRLDINDPLAYVLAFLLTAILGWGDEGIQYCLPNRFYEHRDVFINIFAGGLGLFVTFIVRREAYRKNTL